MIPVHRPRGRPRLTPEERLDRAKASQQRRNQRPEVKAAKREYMKRYNLRPEVIEHRKWYWHNVALPRLRGRKANEL